MSRRRIQQLRDAGARRHSDDVRVGPATDDDDDYDDDGGGGGGGGGMPSNRIARRIRSLANVADCYRSRMSPLKVGLVWSATRAVLVNGALVICCCGGQLLLQFVKGCCCKTGDMTR